MLEWPSHCVSDACLKMEFIFLFVIIIMLKLIIIIIIIIMVIMVMVIIIPTSPKEIALTEKHLSNHRREVSVKGKAPPPLFNDLSCMSQSLSTIKWVNEGHRSRAGYAFVVEIIYFHSSFFFF